MATYSQIITIAHVNLALPLFNRQIPDLRRNICRIIASSRDQLNLFNNEEATWFHNHDESGGNIKEIAKIHYRVAQNDKGKHLAQLVGFNEAAIALEKLSRIIESMQPGINIEGKSTHLALHTQFDQNTYEVRKTSDAKWYRLTYWIPLNRDNYNADWKQAADLSDRLPLLNLKLNKHLISCLSNLGINGIDDDNARIQYIYSMKKVKVMNTDMLAFDIDYTCNAELPPGIALGRAVSRGFGVQHPIEINSKR